MNTATWNMLGAKHSQENKWNEGVKNLIAQKKLDYLCLQECGGMPDSAELIKENFNNQQDLMLYAWNRLYVLFYAWDVHGNRCNLAIITPYQPVEALVVYPGGPKEWRPAIGCTTAQHKEWIFSLHAISPNGPDAVDLLIAISKSVQSNTWIALGDYNREPHNLEAALQHKGLNYEVNPPDADTFNTDEPTRKLDYAVSPKRRSKGIRTGIILSDHFPVYFQF